MCMKRFILFTCFLCLVALKGGQSKKYGHASKSNANAKIVGGYNTTIQKVPYQVVLIDQEGDDYYVICGGSIISNRYILTAAHCIDDLSKVHIRAGSTNAKIGGAMYTSELLRIHPKYNSGTSDYDVGIIKTKQTMKIDGNNTKVVTLPDLRTMNTSIPRGTQVLVSGWGDTSEKGSYSDTLMAVSVRTITNADCKKSYGNDVTARMFCAGERRGGKDACKGDSGGPAVDKKSGVQLGIVSFGQGCGRYPGVYTNLKEPKIRRWIKRNTGV